MKIVRKGWFSCDRKALSDFYGWHKSLRHPYIARLYDCGLTHRMDLFCIREFLSGTLDDCHSPIELAAELLDAVSFLQSKGQVHGGIKPSNILFSTSMRLADPQLGLFRRPELTEEDIRFSAPEVIDGGPITAESDLYSAAAVLYRLFSGQDPFDDFSMANLKSKYLWASARPLSSVLHIKREVSDGIAKMLQRDPEMRRAGYSSLANEFNKLGVTAKRAPLVGRAFEVQRTRTFLYHAGQAGLRAVFVEGQMGIGKSRFIEQLQIDSAFWNFDFAIHRCEEGASNGLDLILASLMDLERNRNFKMPKFSENDIRNASDSSFQVVVAESAKPMAHWPAERLITNIIGELARLARKQPIIWVIEDLHWADNQILALVRQLAYRAQEISIRLVLTRRNDCLECPIYSTLDACLGDKLLKVFLGPLRPADSLILVDYFETNRRAQSKIVESSSGNPLFIREFAKQRITDSKVLPQAVDAALKCMVSGLSRPTQSVLQIMSIFDKPISAEIIRNIADLPETLFQACNSELVRLDLVEEGTKSLFLKHIAVRAKIYDSLQNSTRVRLHRAAYLRIRDHERDEGALAYHAFKGGLFEPAGHLYARLAKASWNNRNYRVAFESYKRLEQCLSRQGKCLPYMDVLKFAKCHAVMGKHTTARQMCDRITSSVVVTGNGELLSTAYTYLAAMGQHQTASDRINLRTRAVQCLPQDSPLLVQRYLQLSEALICVGDFVRAAEHLRNAEAHQCSPKDAHQVANGRAQLLLNQGEFREAAKLMSASSRQNGTNAGALNNHSFCLEMLGDLREARTIQLKAQSLAIAVGYLPIEVLSLGNLGAIETKLGNFIEAEQLFKVGAESIDRFRTRDKEFGAESLSTLLADSACLFFETGRYSAAITTLRSLNTLDESRYQVDSIHIALIKAEVYLRLGGPELVTEVLELLAALPAFHTAFHETERIFFVARLADIPNERTANLLREGVRISSELGTKHQQCILLNELSHQLLLLGQTEEANRQITQSFKIAKQGGYRPILAQALLLRGLAVPAHQARQKARWLAQAFKLASEIGMPELVAESAFHIGAHQMQCGHHLTAKEYLLKSTSITAELAEQIPLKFRARYLAKFWRKEARRLLDECVKKVEPPALSLHGEVRGEQQDERLFRGLYRLTVSAGVARDVDAFTSSLVQTLDKSIRRRAVVMLKRGDRIDWHPVRVKLSQELMTKVAGLSDKARGRIYFGGEKNPTKDTVAWIPFQSERNSGGVYVSCRPMEPPLAERELEFLTILGTVASGALDQIEARQGEPRQSTQAVELHGMVGNSKVMRDVYFHVEAAARSGATVLVEGESGTGKELVARAIHKSSARASGPFIAVDCGAIPETLIESELFGSQKGAFTGAVTDRQGLFEAANKGTIFLDEIGNTTPSLQAKLLRAIQEREIRRIGETRSRPVDVRLIAATNCDLDKLVQEKRFRRDLLYRLKVLHIELPALRNRREDIPRLAQSFLERLNAANKTKKHFAASFFDGLSTYKFPGNIRELHNIIERSFILSSSNAITGVPIENKDRESASSDDVSAWFSNLTDGKMNFWSAVHDKYKKRDISRETITALVDLGLKSTRGSYKALASSFHIDRKEYRRFMDFLRRNQCHLDFRPYRKGAATQ